MYFLTTAMAEFTRVCNENLCDVASLCYLNQKIKINKYFLFSI